MNTNPDLDLNLAVAPHLPAVARPRPLARIPLVVKLAFTAFMTVLVPVYWAEYGPTNFLYFCDLALFFTLVAVWRESALLAALPVVILLPSHWFLCRFAGWPTPPRKHRNTAGR